MKLWSRLKKNKIRSSIAYTIKPRKVKFEWQDSPIDWIPNQPFASYFINEINMILPAGEFWFCRLYNKVLPQISDEKLKQDVQAFIAKKPCMRRHTTQPIKSISAKERLMSPVI
jgi:predicted metal-dependent hydrolase